MSQHALLGASSSHKWLVCTRSARLEETMPEVKSTYADEGSLAHEIGELKLRKAFVEPMGMRTFNSRLKKLQEKPLYDPEMLTCTDVYLDYVSKIAHSFTTSPYIAVEKRIDYGTYVPEGFGTGDCILIGGNTIYVIDYKHGKGVPVSAEENPQMMLYALGAYTEYSFLYLIEKVVMVIIQPRLDNISEYEMPIDFLLRWGENIKPLAEMAFKGEGELISGDHCGFCKAKATCRARADVHTALEDFKQMKPPLISNEEVGEILLRAQNLAKWVKDLEDYALAELIKGNDIAGWKAVEGRSNRVITDVDKAFEVLKTNGTDEAMLYERKPLGITALEALIGKKVFGELLTSYIDKPPGKPTLAVITDKREAIKRTDAAEDFGNA